MSPGAPRRGARRERSGPKVWRGRAATASGPPGSACVVDGASPRRRVPVPPRVAGLGGGDAARGLAPQGASGARLGSPRPRPPSLPTAVERSRVRERLRRALPRPAENHPRRRCEKTVRAIECNGCIANARAVAVAAATRSRPASQNGGTGHQPAPPSRTRAPALKGDPRTCRDRSVWPRRPQRPRMTRRRRPPRSTVAAAAVPPDAPAQQPRKLVHALGCVPRDVLARETLPLTRASRPSRRQLSDRERSPPRSRHWEHRFAQTRRPSRIISPIE